MEPSRLSSQQKRWHGLSSSLEVAHASPKFQGCFLV